MRDLGGGFAGAVIRASGATNSTGGVGKGHRGRPGVSGVLEVGAVSWCRQ